MDSSCFFETNEDECSVVTATDIIENSSVSSGTDDDENECSTNNTSSKEKKPGKAWLDEVVVADDIDSIIEKHSHAKYLKKLNEIVKDGTFIGGGNDLCDTLGLGHETSGGDLRSEGLAGDIKFYGIGRDICISGDVNKTRIREQGEMLIIGYHPYGDNNTVVYSSFLNVWAVDGIWSEVESILQEYDEWKMEGRQNMETTKFNSKNCYIKLHSGKNKDRFYFKNSFIKQYQTIFNKAASYSKKSVDEARIAKITKFYGSQIEEPRGTVVWKDITLSEIIEGILPDNIDERKFKIPKYQRGIVTGPEFIRKFIGETVLQGLADIRGVLMLHETSPGTYYIVDGQQRINAIREFFVKSVQRLNKEMKPIVLNGKIYDVSNLTWKDITGLVEHSDIIKNFVSEVMSVKFKCKIYIDYSFPAMALEYTIANTMVYLNRHELRSAWNSRMNDVICHTTVPGMENPQLTEWGVEILPDFVEGKNPKETLKRINVTSARMNCRSLNAFIAYAQKNWGEKYIENDDMIDSLWEEHSTDDLSTVRDIAINTNNFKKILVAAMDKHTVNKKRFSTLSGYVFGNQSEFDLFQFIVLELIRRHPGKKLSFTKDVISPILERNSKLSCEQNSLLKDMTEAQIVSAMKKNPSIKRIVETTYGLSVRKGQRTWTEITGRWFPAYIHILDVTDEELLDLGFRFE